MAVDTTGTTDEPLEFKATATSNLEQTGLSQSVQDRSFATAGPDQKTIDDVRPLKVAVIGAGLSGILAGILLPAKVPHIQLTIFEKNNEVGGTWLENIYPGVRCDIAANVYQSTFAPNTQWSEKFASGAEIRDYWQAVAHKYNVYQYVRFNHSVKALEWNDDVAKWAIKFETQGQHSNEDFDFVIPCIGIFNAWKLPDYPGIQNYKGLLRHTSNWDPTFNPEGKKVAVIGNGASGIQIVPNLQRTAAHIDHYARNKTWVAASWIPGDVRTFEPQNFTAEQLKSFEDPETYLKFRKEQEEKYWRGFRGILRGTQENDSVRQASLDRINQVLAKKPELIENLIPDFSPSCRRLTPGPGYLEALTEDNVDFIQTPIKEFTETGIVTVDGKHREVDAIFCATGANVDLITPFPIVAHGLDLRDAWSAGGKWGYPYTYLGLATPGFPNLLWTLGAHGAGVTGTIPQAVEVQLTYYAKLLRKVSSQGIKSVSPSTAATDDFITYAKKFFASTVFTENCRSWANGGKANGFIHGHWPGSGLHVTIIRKEPRWEDWEYKYYSEDGNRFDYFGSGYTKKELDPDADLVSYLKLPDQIDLRSLNENWWE